MRSSWVLSSILAGVVYACGSETTSTFDGDDASNDSQIPLVDGADGNSSNDVSFVITDGSPQVGNVTISPQDAVVDWVAGTPLPMVQYTATINGAPAAVAWSIDRGELGTIGLNSGSFSPSGKLGGTARIVASVGGKAVSTGLTVKLKTIQNGAQSIPDAGAPDGGSNSSGGRGGVGGDPVGGAVLPATQTVLQSAPVADVGMKWLYPYDKTVWPRGILAPQLQWAVGAQGDYDAVRIQISETNYSYDGYFAKNATPFINHPIPQDVWVQLARSNAGEEVSVSLTFSKGATAYGPIVEKWKIASAPLKGTVYYNSYGTRLAKNYGGALGPNPRFGGATLAIRGNSTDPTLIAGSDVNVDGCRVCHSVSADGSVLVTQRRDGNARLFSSYDLKSNSEVPFLPTPGEFAWPAIYPDGSFLFNDSSPSHGATATPSKLYRIPSTFDEAGPTKTPQPVTTAGLPANLRAGTPMFSPDGKLLAFNYYAGAGADQRSLAILPFDKATATFGALTKFDAPANAAHTAIWPSFTPDSKRIVYEVETRYNGRDFGGTRGGAACEAVNGCTNTHDAGTRAELWQLDLATKQIVRLNNLNGVGHAPTGPNVHNDDTTLNYEPTINPVVSGGYAWVVFTSRRLYGNIATINPWQSDPRFTDISSKPTTKKLWVAAIDLNAPPGTDSSYPAFYLPAQELLAGNSRGFWVVDPCKAQGNSCETGDECCGGYCRANASGALVCSNEIPTCSQEFEKCTTAADCCDNAKQCINNRCARSGPI